MTTTNFKPPPLTACVSPVVEASISAGPAVVAGDTSATTEGSLTAVLGLPATAIVYDLVSILYGPATATVALNGPATFLGSRHESEQVPPQPYWKLKVRSYVPSALLIRTFGACG